MFSVKQTFKSFESGSGGIATNIIGKSKHVSIYGFSPVLVLLWIVNSLHVWKAFFMYHKRMG